MERFIIHYEHYHRSLGPVIVYDLSCLLPVQKYLGENYVLVVDAYIRV